MKRVILSGLAALSIMAGTATAAGDPTPTSVEAKCLKTTTVSAPLPDPEKALTVYSKLSMFCKISLVDAKYHPETKLYYSIDQFVMVRRKNDMVPFTQKGRIFYNLSWKPMKKVGSNLFIANHELERKVAVSSKFYEWQGQAKVSYRIEAVDHENHTPIMDEKTTDLKVSAITELRLK